MSFTKGIIKCKQVLIRLSSKNNFAKRIDDAFSEISEIDPDETSADYLLQVVEWCEAYLSLRDKAKLDGVSNEKDEKTQLIELSQKLTLLCTDIIEFNSKSSDN